MDMFPYAGAGTGNGAETGAAPSSDGGQMIDLVERIDKTKCYARNEDSKFPMTNLFIGDSRLGCKSDADEQLIIHIAFHEVVRIKSLELIEFNEGRDPECNPSKIHLFVDRENLGFEDAEDVDPTQTLHITTEDMKKPILLKFVKYQRVNSLTLFVEDNQGGEVTAIGGLKLYGWPVTSTNMADFNKKSPDA